MPHLFSFLTLLTTLACAEQKPAPMAPPPAAAAAPATPAPALTGEQQALIETGKKIYRSQCIACHNFDITKDGVQGPAIAGSSLELLEARIMRLEYPAGYKPKRATKNMRALPMLKKYIPALHAFLNAPPEKK